MSKLNTSVPDPMNEWVQTQIEQGKYASSSDYVWDLIRKDQEEKGKLAALQAAIALGIESCDAGDLHIEAIKKKAKHASGLYKPRCQVHFNRPRRNWAWLRYG